MIGSVWQGNIYSLPMLFMICGSNLHVCYDVDYSYMDPRGCQGRTRARDWEWQKQERWRDELRSSSWTANWPFLKMPLVSTAVSPQSRFQKIKITTQETKGDTRKRNMPWAIFHDLSHLTRSCLFTLLIYHLSNLSYIYCMYRVAVLRLIGCRAVPR